MPPKPQADPIKHCLQCNAIMKRKRCPSALESNIGFRRRKFCDQKCMAAHMTGRIKVANAKNSRRQSGRVAARECAHCHRTGCRLHVHHIDHDPMNNTPSNLKTLCGSCHRRCHSPNYEETGLQPLPCLHCDKPSVKRRLCNTHLTRLKKYGDPSLTKIRTASGWELTRVDGSTSTDPR